MKKLCEQIRSKLKKANESYKKKTSKHRKKTQFQPGDFVWIYLRKKRSPSRQKNKIMPRANGLFKVLKRFGDNTYKIDLSRDYGLLAASNVGDLSLMSKMKSC